MVWRCEMVFSLSVILFFWLPHCCSLVWVYLCFRRIDLCMAWIERCWSHNYFVDEGDDAKGNHSSTWWHVIWWLSWDLVRQCLQVLDFAHNRSTMVIFARFTSYSPRQIKPFNLLTQQQISIQQQKYVEHFNVHFYEYEIVAIFVRAFSKKGEKRTMILLIDIKEAWTINIEWSLSFAVVLLAMVFCAPCRHINIAEYKNKDKNVHKMRESTMKRMMMEGRREGGKKRTYQNFIICIRLKMN